MRRVRLAVVGALVVVVAVVGVSTGVNQVANRVSLARLDVPGVLVDVGGGSRMHVFSRAAHSGGPTLVFLAGMGEGSAYYQFKGIFTPLEADYNVATVDYLGYGFSDTTRKDRTNENIATEIHTALKGAGVQGPYVLVAHSIGGLYSLKFADLFPDDVAGFIGLDNSVPGQQAPDTYQGDIRSDSGLYPTYSILRFMGLARVERWINGDNSIFFPANPLLSSEDRANDWLLKNTKLDLWVLDNEESWYLPNDIELQGQRFPSTIPTLMILAQDSIDVAKQYDMPGWVEVHEAVASENPLSNIVTLPGGHMVYQNNPDQVVAQIDKFLTATA